MAQIMGAEVPIPSINFTGIISSTWIYFLVIIVIGIILITGIGLLLYYKTFNRKVVFFENISGMGFQPVMRKRARILKLGTGGEEVLAVLGGTILSSYGRKMGPNTYWFAKAQDGFWYNFLMGDLDSKMAIMDIEPIDKDITMFHIAKDRMNRDNYLKRGFMEKYGSIMIMFFFLIALIVGLWLIVGKVGKATTSLAATAETNANVANIIKDEILAFNNLRYGNTTSGIVPVLTGG